MASRINPVPAYQDPGNILSGDKELYARIGKIAETGRQVLIKEFEIPIRSGKAWVVKKGASLLLEFSHSREDASHRAISVGITNLLNQDYDVSSCSNALTGQLCTLSTPKGPQVGDLNIWSLHNPREHFWAARTRQLHASHVTVGDRLWSCLPYLRPLCTIVADSLKYYGVDEVGGRCHDLLGTRCDPYGVMPSWMARWSTSADRNLP